MLGCYSLAALLAIAFVALTMSDSTSDDLLTLLLFGAPFFFVLGLNALVWRHYDTWGGRHPDRGVRILTVIAMVILLIVLSVLAVFLIVLAVVMLYPAM